MLNKINRILKINMFGEDVVVIQEFLKKHGMYNGPINGYFNSDLMLSVKKFQKMVGLNDTGIVNVLTLSKMISYSINNSSLNKYIEPKYVDVNNFVIYGIKNDINIDYNTESTQKKRILLSITGGSYRPDLSVNNRHIYTVSKNGQTIRYISAHYIIGRKSSYNNDCDWDGVVINVYDDYFWNDYIKTKNDKFNKETICIDICCSGPLRKLSNDVFVNNYNIIVNKEDVIELKRPYKGHIYWEKYTENQIDNLKKLIEYLVKKHNIKMDNISIDTDWFNYNPRNISDNINITTTGRIYKNDYGIFPQEDLIEMLNGLKKS